MLQGTQAAVPPCPDTIGSMAALTEQWDTILADEPDDWSHLDDAIEEEGHTAVLIRPTRVYSNPEEPPAGAQDPPP